MTIFSRLKMCAVVAYHMLRVSKQSVWGVWRIATLPKPMISVFGGHRMEINTPYSQQATQLVQMLIDSDVSVLTGGGSGIMEAASRGAAKEGKIARTMGISVKGLEDRNPYVKEYMQLDYLFARKWLLTHYSHAYVIFPGGFGTLDELAEILTSMQTKSIERRPIVLIGVEYWSHFMHWVKYSAQKNHLILDEEADWFTMTDDLMQAYELVCEACGKPPIKK